MSHSHPPEAVVEVDVRQGFRLWGHIDLCTICNETVGDYRPTCQHRAWAISVPDETQRQRGIVVIETCVDCGSVKETLF